MKKHVPCHLRLVPSLLCLFISKELEELSYEKWTLKILEVTPSLFCLFTNKELEEFFLNILLYTETIPSLLCLFISKELEEFFICIFTLTWKTTQLIFISSASVHFCEMNPFSRMIFTKNEHFSLSFHLFWNQTRRKKKEERKKKKEARRQNNGLAYCDKLGACPFSTKRTLFLRTLGGKCGRFHKNRNPLATNMKMMILETNHNFWQ